TNRGGASNPTTIFAAGWAPSFPGVSVALLPGTGSTIAGFTITNAGGNFHDGLILSNSSVTLRHNTITGQSRYGINIDASTNPNHMITGNQIVNNPGSGLGFINGGTGSKVENNVITGNGVGVEYDVAGGNLGGPGSAGEPSSAGGNVISCNAFDLYVAAAIPVSAANNFWDHSPSSMPPGPTLGCTGEDICDSGVPVDTSGAMLAPSPCAP